MSDPDVGFVFGAGATLVAESASTGPRATIEDDFDYTEGDDIVEATYTITVPPGGTVSLALFTIMSPARTSSTALTGTERPTRVDQEIATIRANVLTDGQYFTGMTQAQIDGLANF